MTEKVIEACETVNISASAAVATGPGSMLGIFVASASATPTIKVWGNNAASGNIIVNTFTPAAGTFYPIPAKFAAGCYISIGGTVDLTAFINRNG
jgi:hypothetical protein